MRAFKGLGDRVQEDEIIAIVSGPFGENEQHVMAKAEGIIIGRTNLPVVNRGDALFHIAKVRSSTSAEEAVEASEIDVENDPLFDEPEIV